MLTPSRTALVFPGQGSQAVGMGLELAAAYPSAAAACQQGDDLLGFSLSQLSWHGPADTLNDTINTQPALLLHSAAALRVLEASLPGFTPAFVAGHSMGQVSALHAAGSLNFADALRLARRRGELMKQAGEQSPGGMAAILGLDIPTLERICAEASQPGETVQVANDNCPGQVVISGASAALGRALEGAKAAGARRALPLAVSIAAHSELMRSAQSAFTEAVAATGLSAPHVPVIGNVTAAPLHSLEDIQAELQAQLTSRVRWTESIQYLSSAGVDTFLEVGSGSVLGGLIKRIAPDARTLSLGAPADFETLRSWLD